MQRRDLLIAGSLSGVAASASIRAAETSSSQSAALKELNGIPLRHAVDDPAAPTVFFSREITPESLLKLYETLGRPARGKTGIKITFESPNGPHLDPALLKLLCDKVQGTLIDCNGFTGPRDTTAGNLRVAEGHGFTGIAPIDILDSDGDMDLPVRNGYRLKFARTGRHFAQYESLISVVRFKAHHLPRYGGTMKNLSICLGSISGKAIIHSGGAVTTHYTSTSREVTAEAMADAVKAAMDYRKDRWCFINVLDAFSPDDNCSHARNLGNIGIFASIDPVAVDQAAVDVTFGAAPDEETRRSWEEYHSTMLLPTAEKIGVGRTHYRLLSID